MSDITLVRMQSEPIPKADADAARRVLFGMVDGLGERGKKQWRRFFNGLMRLEPGEMVEIKTHKARSGVFHRRHMLIETRVFEAQEKFDDFEVFRVYLKIACGFVTWHAGARGGVVPVPKSISYAKLEQGEMQEFHESVIAFFRTEAACKTFWPRLTPLNRELAMEAILMEFER